MPPKKEKVAAAPKQVVVGEYDLTGMSRLELQSFVFRLQEEVEKSRYARNAVQVERDEVYNSLECYRREIQTKENQILQKEHELEEANKEFEKLMTERKQKEKFLNYEHKKNLENEATFAANEMQQLFDESYSAQNVLLKDLKDKEIHVRLTQKQYEETFANVDAARKAHLNESLMHREDKLKNAIQAYEKMYEELNNNIMLLKDIELHELGEMKTNEYKEYRQKYVEVTEEMKQYFKTTVGRSLSLIDTLKRQIQDLKSSEYEMIKLRQEILKENDELEPCCKELRTSKVHAAHYEQHKKSDTFTRKRIKEYEKRIKELDNENAELTEKYKNCAAAVDCLRVQYVSALRSVADSLRAKKEILERKMQMVLNELQQMGENIQSLKLQDIDSKELSRFIKTSQ